MPIQRLSPHTEPERIAEVLAADGCAVVERLVAPEVLDAILGEMRPHLEAVAPGSDAFSGHQTRRVGALIARAPSSHAVILHPTIVGSVERTLAKSTSVQLHLTQVIAIGPGESAQTIHRDQWAFDFFPFPAGFEVQCNTLWAMTDFTEANGATRVVVGSHRFEDKLRLEQADTEPAEMEAGSVLIYTGSLYHGGGANRTDAVRYGLNVTYARSWLRQEENQYLTVPREIAATLPRELQRLMGYARGAYALGYVDDLRDPIEVLGVTDARPGFAADPAERGDGER